MEKMVEREIVKLDGSKETVLVAEESKGWMDYVKVGAVAIHVVVILGRYFLVKG